MNAKLIWLAPNGSKFELTVDRNAHLGRDLLAVPRLGNHLNILFDEGYKGISRHHADLEQTKDGLVLHDLGSLHGTYVNAHPVSTPTLLASNDVVTLAKGYTGTRFRVEYFLEDEHQALVIDDTERGDGRALLPYLIMAHGFTQKNLHCEKADNGTDLSQILSPFQRSSSHSCITFLYVHLPVDEGGDLLLAGTLVTPRAFYAQLEKLRGRKVMLVNDPDADIFLRRDYFSSDTLTIVPQPGGNRNTLDLTSIVTTALKHGGSPMLGGMRGYHFASTASRESQEFLVQIPYSIRPSGDT